MATDFSWESWGKTIRVVKGLLLVSVLFPDGSSMTPLIPDETNHETAEMMRKVAFECFGVFENLGLGCSRMSWSYDKAVVHALQLPDKTTVIALSLRGTSRFDHNKFDQLLTDIEQAYAS